MLNHTLQANTTLISQNCHHREHLSSILPGLRPMESGPGYQSEGWENKIKMILKISVMVRLLLILTSPSQSQTFQRVESKDVSSE